MHPLFEALVAAAGGSFPPVDGIAEVHPPDDAGTNASVEFTGHAFVLTDESPSDVIALGADGFGGATHPDLLRWLAGPTGWIGSHDAVLAAIGTGGGQLAPRTDLDDHPRVRRAREHRRDVRVHGDDSGFVTFGHGLVGRLEISVELLDQQLVGRGEGRRLIEQGLKLVGAGELLWAQVAPGNAASLKAFLSCGFVPIGAEVLLTPEPARR